MIQAVKVLYTEGNRELGTISKKDSKYVSHLKKRMQNQIDFQEVVVANELKIDSIEDMIENANEVIFNIPKNRITKKEKKPIKQKQPKTTLKAKAQYILKEKMSFPEFEREMYKNNKKLNTKTLRTYYSMYKKV